MSQPFVQDADFTLYNGDALEVLRELPEASVHCCVTSPPFYGLRDYGVEGQIGLEATPEEWVAKLVAVFREVRRVLRPDGCLWVEVGDSYAAKAGGAQGQTGQRASRTFTAEGVGRGVPPGLKPKDLIGTPWLLAFALRADGWWLRQANVWWHTNCLPESAKDRPTSAHSYVFLFSPSARYFYDQVAVQEPAAWDRWGAQNGAGKYAGEQSKGAMIQARTKQELQKPGSGTTRNLRSVWPIPTEGYPEAHFATMPTRVVELPILAGTSERGCCPECGGPWVREVERELHPVQRTFTHTAPRDGFHKNPEGHIPAQQTITTTGWRPSCEHVDIPGSLSAGDPPHELAPSPCTVLDPFGGSGTTALVARKHGRRSVLIELSENYCKLAADRLSQLSLLAEPA